MAIGSKLKEAVMSYVVEQFVSGMLEEYFSKRTFQEILAAAEQGRGWDAISPTIKMRILRMAKVRPRALAKIGYDNIIVWLQQANPEVAQAVFSNPITSQWIGKLWTEFERLRSQVLNGDFSKGDFLDGA